MIWEYFIWFAVVALLLWAFGAAAAWMGKRRLATLSTVLGLTVFFGYIVLMWVSLERPPLRTMGETRLWYSALLPFTGLIVYSRWQYRWILSYSTMLSLVFVCVNLFKPEIHTKELMPALQSPWFAPHVIVYMFAYAVLGVATLISAYTLWRESRPQPVAAESEATLSTLDNLVRVGLAFLTVGMLFGALWAKEAWGHYWTWDPKETWAAITWLAYLTYLHYRHLPYPGIRPALWMLIIAFILLQMCWWGINYLPSAQATSVHTYSS